MNSYVRPKVATYVEQLQSQLAGIGAQAEVNILRSDAGLMTTQEAARNPIYGILSGPSGGVAGALFVAARRASTTSSPSTWAARRPTSRSARTASRRSAARPRSATSGSRCRPCNVHTVGAGGGSIAHVPELTKALRVGPQSAGAEPGPAAYGKGGDRADRDRRERRRSGTCRRACSAARWSSTSRPPGPPCRRSPTRWACDVGRAGGRGDPRDREREHGRRASPRLRPARPRPARVRARRLRRRRPAARERGREDDGLVPGDRPAGTRAFSARSATSSPTSATSSRRPTSALVSEADPAEVAAILDELGGARGAVARGRGHRAGGARGSPTSPTCATAGRATRSRSRSTRTRSAPTVSPTSTSASTGSTSSCTASGCTGTASRDRQPARGRLRRRAEARASGGRAATGATRRAPSWTSTRSSSTASGFRRRSTTGRSSTPGLRFDGPAIVTEFDSTTVVLPGLRGRRST